MCTFSDVRSAKKAVEFINDHEATKTIHFDGFVPTNNDKCFASLYNEKTKQLVNQRGMAKVEQTFAQCVDASHIEMFRHTNKGQSYQLGKELPKKVDCFEFVAYAKYKLDKYFVKVFNVQDCNGNSYPIVVFHRADQYSYTI